VTGVQTCALPIYCYGRSAYAHVGQSGTEVTAVAGSSSAIVAGLTAAALATVGWLGYQASANVPADLRQARAGTAPAAPEAPRSGSGPTALPARSGQGERV